MKNTLSGQVSDPWIKEFQVFSAGECWQWPSPASLLKIRKNLEAKERASRSEA